MESSAFRFVPALDGVRGIAIIVVLIHHQLTPFSLSGGFLGVDFFFVLSGFLITSLLLSEFQTSGDISIRNFYMRRVLRLAPALILYLAATIIVSYWLNLIDFGRQVKLIGMAIGYATNWRMALGWDRALDPTAIIWSLSIEEQFYVLWPLLLFLCLRAGIKKNYIAGGLAVVITLIAIHRFKMLGDGTDLSRLYYGTDTRADALLVGCLTAFVPRTLLASNIKPWLNAASILAFLSLALLTGVVEFTDRWLYAGGFTAIAALAAIVIVTTANTQPSMVVHVLRWFPLRWFGRISYGLYLWHWLVVRTTSFYYLGYWEPWARLVLAVGISAASFYLIEIRFNRLKKQFGSRKEGKPAPPSEVSGFAASLTPTKPSEA